MKIRNIINLLVIIALFAIEVSAQTNTTVIVTGDTAAGENQPGWLFNRDLATSTPYQFDTAKASIGKGSIYILPIGSNAYDKFIAENFINTAITNVQSISYAFQIGSGGAVVNPHKQFYMNVYANFGVSDDLSYGNCVYNIVPTVGTTLGFTTVTFDPNVAATSVRTRSGSPFTCPLIPAQMEFLSSGSNIRMFALNVGDTSTVDVGLDGFYDNVVVTLTNGDSTTYDFEPSKEACKRGGWQYFTSPAFENQGQCISYIQSNH